MKNILLGGFLSGIILNITGLLFDKFLLANVYAECPKVFLKPMDQVWQVKMVIFYFLVGMILASAYHFFKHRVPGTGFAKGLAFGVIIWLAAYLPSMVFLYLVAAIRVKLITMWILNWFFNFALAGGSLGMIDED